MGFLKGKRPINGCLFWSLEIKRKFKVDFPCSVGNCRIDTYFPPQVAFDFWEWQKKPPNTSAFLIFNFCF
jgi:hypothetical protein